MANKFSFGSNNGGGGGFGSPSTTGGFGKTTIGGGGGGFGFGSNNTSTTTTTTSGFGLNTGGFGNTKTNTNSFSFNQPTKTGFGSNFTSTTNNNSNNNNTGFNNTGFNSSGNSFSMGGQFNTLSQHQQQQQLKHLWAGSQKLRELKMAYAPLVDQNNEPIPEGRGIPGISNVGCDFNNCVYNQRDPRIGNSNLNIPTHLSLRRKWEEAERNNPDPEHLVTALEIGTGSLKRRFDQQKTQANRLKEYCDDILSTLVIVNKSSHLSSTKISELEVKQSRLYHKLLVVIRKLELLRLYRKPLTADEQRYRERLDRLVRALRIPSAKIQELITVQTQLDRSVNEVYGDEPNPTDEEKLCMIMEKQREGLQHLTDIVRKDLRDLEILKNELSRNQQNNSRYFD